MFKTDLEKWYDSLPAHTKTWIDKQPVWHDADLFRFFAMGIFVGFLIGLIF